MSQETSLDPARATLGEALRDYLETLKPEQRNTQGVYVRKYVEHAGDTFLIAALSGSRVESYAETQIRVSDPAAQERVAALKAWFQFLKKRNYTTTNYGIHIRVRKTTVVQRGPGATAASRTAPEAIEMTSEGLEALKKELDDLNAQLPSLVKAIAIAREDKDFRENAPLDAAREALAFSEQRRKQIEGALKRAVVVEQTTTDAAVLGSTVVVTRLDSGKQEQYRLVGAREANLAERKISVESPVGKELLGRRVGDEVTVKVPSGEIDYRVESITQG